MDFPLKLCLGKTRLQTMSESYTEQLDHNPQVDWLSPVTAKWGAAIDAGFQLVPDVLLKNQTRLGMSATEMSLLRRS